MSLKISRTLPISGIILAGGQGKRFVRGNKLVFPLAGIPCIRRAIRALYRCCSEVIIVTSAPENFSETGPIFINDVSGPKGTVRGVIAGLQAARFDWSLIVGADMPFPNPALAARQYDFTNEADAVWLQHARGWMVPFHGLLHKRSIEALYCDMQAGFPNLDGFTAERLKNRLSIRQIPHTEVLKYDHDLNCFFDVDTENDIQEAEQRIKEPHETLSGRVIGIDGPPGAGKTTLIQSFLEQHTDIAALRPFSKGNGLEAYSENLRRHAEGCRALLLDRTLLSSVCRDVFDLNLFSQERYNALLEPLWPTATHYVALLPEFETLLERRREKLASADLRQRYENMRRAVAYYTERGIPITVCRNQAEARPLIKKLCTDAERN